MDKYIHSNKLKSPIMPPKKDRKARNSLELGIESHTEPPLQATLQIDTNNLVKQISDIVMPQFDGIRKEISGLVTELKQFAHRITEVEGRVSDLEDTNFIQQETMKVQEDKLLVIQKRLDDLEDRSRRNNLKIVGLPETVEYGDLLHFVTHTLPQALGIPNDRIPIPIERVHRLGAIRSQDDTVIPKRPIIFRCLNFQDKTLILNSYRKINTFIIKGNRVLIFQDFSTDTLKQRKEMAPFCTQLINQGIKVSLMYPAKLKIWYDSKILVLQKPQEARDFIANIIKSTAVV